MEEAFEELRKCVRRRYIHSKKTFKIALETRKFIFLDRKRKSEELSSNEISLLAGTAPAAAAFRQTL